MQKKNPLSPAGLTASLLVLGMVSSSLATGSSALFPASAARGATVYAKACAACHGENGDGNGPGAGPLNPKPRDFTTGMYKFRSTPFGELPTDNDLFTIVSEGIPHSQMPAWKNVLSEQERLDVVAYIKGFSEDFKNPVADTVVIPEAPPSSPELVAEGRKVFMTMECWACHGVQGRGDGKSADVLMDNWGHPVRPMDFTQPKYKRGSDPRSVYKTFSTGLNGTPMPSFADAFLFGGDKEIDTASYAASFSKQELQELQAYFQSQPKAADIEAMKPEQKDALAQERKWALAYYIHSLIQKPNLFQWLFTEDMNLTR